MAKRFPAGGLTFNRLIIASFTGILIQNPIAEISGEFSPVQCVIAQQ